MRNMEETLSKLLRDFNNADLANIKKDMIAINT